jgi:hypothetical protein
MSCKRSNIDLNSVKLLKDLNISTDNSEPEYTASVSDQTAVGEEHTIESSNSSEPEDIGQNLRALNIEPGLAAPEGNLPTQRIFPINCKHPDTTCVTVRCGIYGPIGKLSKAVVSLKMFADFENLGESTFPWPVFRSCRV